MAVRPDNHITGDIAVRNISSKLIPEEWTISTPQSDYGLDMLIEVVNENMTTGKFFFIQSKGTINSSQNDLISYSLEVERIKDYNKIDIPVLFVYYSKSDNKFWGRWMNSVYDTLTDKQKQQKKVTLYFNSNNEIDTDYLRSIGEKIDMSITRNVSVRCKELTSEFKNFHGQVINVAHQYVGPNISGDDRLASKTVWVSYSGTIHDGKVILTSDKECVSVDLNCAEREWLYYPKPNKSECPDCLLNLIYLIAIYSSNISTQSQDYVLAYPRKSILEILPSETWLMFLNRLKEDKLLNISAVFSEAILCECNEIAEYTLLRVFMASLKDDKYKTLYVELLSEYLSSDYPSEVKGRVLYNLANSIRSVNIYEAFSYYIKAAKYQTLYKEMYYWWQELAGVLYITRHYKFAELFYKKAKRLAPKKCRDDIGILIADCLVCQGRIDEALTEEYMYVDDGHKLTGVINLKMVVTEIISRKNVLIENSTYWFNQGVTASRECRFRDAMECFLICWRLNDGDFEALNNALIEAMNLKDDAKTCLIILAQKEISPDNAYKSLVSLILNNAGEKKMNEVLEPLQKLFYS